MGDRRLILRLNELECEMFSKLLDTCQSPSISIESIVTIIVAAARIGVESGETWY